MDIRDIANMSGYIYAVTHLKQDNTPDFTRIKIGYLSGWNIEENIIKNYGRILWPIYLHLAVPTYNLLHDEIRIHQYLSEYRISPRHEIFDISSERAREELEFIFDFRTDNSGSLIIKNNYHFQFWKIARQAARKARKKQNEFEEKMFQLLHIEAKKKSFGGPIHVEEYILDIDPKKIQPKTANMYNSKDSYAHVDKFDAVLAARTLIKIMGDKIRLKGKEIEIWDSRQGVWSTKMRSIKYEIHRFNHYLIVNVWNEKTLSYKLIDFGSMVNKIDQMLVQVKKLLKIP